MEYLSLFKYLQSGAICGAMVKKVVQKKKKKRKGGGDLQRVASLSLQCARNPSYPTPPCLPSFY